jgi:hypothetical protein
MILTVALPFFVFEMYDIVNIIIHGGFLPVTEN